MAACKAVDPPPRFFSLPMRPRRRIRGYLNALKKFHKRILNWEDYRINLSVIQETNTSSIEAITIRNQLKLVEQRCQDVAFQAVETTLLYGTKIRKAHTRGPRKKKRCKDYLKANV